MSEDASEDPESQPAAASADRVIMPCPFCGGTRVEFEEENFKWCRVICVDCGASSGSVRRYEHFKKPLDVTTAKDRAFAEWNRRVANYARSRLERC